MNILLTMIRLMGQSRYMASIDIKDAYYSFAIKDCDKKFLCFSWQGKLYQFTCLPNGLYCSAPRTFTKIFKVSPVNSMLITGTITAKQKVRQKVDPGLYAVCRWIPVSHVMFLTILLLRSFLFLFILILTLKIDWQCARASHVTPSFLTDDKLEL